MKNKLDGLHIKLIAIFGMFINHMGSIFSWSYHSQTLPLYAISEFVGKFTFPIMAYLLVEGFYYTRNKRKYAARLAMFWLLSIYPFYLMHSAPYGAFSVIDIPNNILFTLLMGLLMLMCYDKVNNKIARFFIVFIFAIFTILSDWNVIGIILVWAFYQFHHKKGIKITLGIYFLVFELIAIIGLFTITHPVRPMIELLGSFGFLVVAYFLTNYNGKRGYSPSWIKWGFYLFYPAHLVILEMISYFLF